MVDLEGCPICGRQPKLVWWNRDRGLHPEITHARYACVGMMDGHVLAAPWAELGLGPKEGDVRLERAARETWNTTVRGCDRA